MIHCLHVATEVKQLESFDPHQHSLANTDCMVHSGNSCESSVYCRKPIHSV